VATLVRIRLRPGRHASTVAPSIDRYELPIRVMINKAAKCERCRHFVGKWRWARGREAGLQTGHPAAWCSLREGQAAHCPWKLLAVLPELVGAGTLFWHAR
jgi:hypothetical protein